MQTLETKIEETRERLEMLKNAGIKLIQRQESLEKEMKNLNRDQLLEIESKNALDREYENLKSNLFTLEERIKETYQTDFVEVSNRIDSIRASVPELEETEINKLRLEIKNLGPVYPESIEEYQRYKERYLDLKKQYDDLIHSEENILETIDSLNTSMTKQFSERFRLLNEKFNSIFCSLFEGGEARMEYVDPEDILESGIELSAQPPGKSLKSLNLLSGGEKAMTAIALLLSFIEINPTPFSILDEIDAALDEQNIHRFTRLLHQMSQNNQFIIITHRNQTLEVCDQINGVTMSKSGVSRLCKLKISEYANE